MNHDPSAAHQIARHPWLIATAAALGLLAVLAVFALQPGSGQAASAKAGAVVSTAHTSIGTILVNSRGHTLYLFGKDKNGKSSCSGQCASFWPPLISTAKARAVAGAKESLIGKTRRADGRMQVTYNHHPLYTFVMDTKKGQTKGEAFSAFGAKWYAVSPAGARILKASSTGNGGGGIYGP
jgi:predicted lipoprotein with Yx(FWY)xxD motif